MPIYRKHNNRIAEYKKEIAFIPFKRPIEYDIVQEVDKFLTASKKQLIMIKGTSNKSGLNEPELQLNYKINNETKSLFSIVGSVNLEKEQNNTQQIEIEMYQLDENY